ncbi:folylpolyglutamate synthase [Oleoguttula sp. CCFEE 5521]
MITPGLSRISRLLATAPLPWPAIHVAGTNGKGSICTYISAMLEAYNASSYRTHLNQKQISHGRFTSPHLIDRWDCITIDGKVVDEGEFKRIESKLKGQNAGGGIGASEFEVLTATAFKLFTNAKVDIAVVEVEPTSGKEAPARAKPLVTTLASISLDHQEWLGDSLAAIAREKAGIMKNGVPAVYGAGVQVEVAEVFETVANEVGADVSSFRTEFGTTDVGLPVHFSASRTASGDTASADFDFSTALGTHERANAILAFRSTWLALQKLKRIPKSSAPLSELGLLPHYAALVQSLLAVPSQVTNPGRSQMLSLTALTGRVEPVLLDGAHNAEAALALRETIETRFPDAKRRTWVIAASSTKDVAALIKGFDVETVDDVLTVEFGEVDGMPWVKAMSAEKVSQAVREVTNRNDTECGQRHSLGAGVESGLKAACQASNGGPLIIAGSLYLVGDVLRLVRRAEKRLKRECAP